MTIRKWTSQVTAHRRTQPPVRPLTATAPAGSDGGAAADGAAVAGQAATGSSSGLSSLTVPLDVLADLLAAAESGEGIGLQITTTTPVAVTFRNGAAALAFGDPTGTVTTNVSSKIVDAVIDDRDARTLTLVGYLCTFDFGDNALVTLTGTVKNQRGQLVLDITGTQWQAHAKDDLYRETFGTLVDVLEGDVLVIDLTGVS